MGIIKSEHPEHSDEVRIEISGTLDFHDRYQFTEAYSCDDPSKMRFVLDLKHTKALDSSALGMLLIMRNDAGEEQANIRIVNCPPDVKKTLLLSKFDQIFQID